eukprot:CAMPEP_0204555468 /NCGR_PEP_ID=MMETSP0661-20131031/28861_1 /ASSEMBLY_ACC=CAM_ASM_000606 /TAXON_ID=109239 /ORGANISM="Alexandrium margalefi, Strain AMGDE01CS-322" /LENGTH=55 /DNA_ID=CAMNT_0051562557 /DNA_START=257 /DNA_END=425 /DNA_ORIENTATION=-
MSQSLAEAVHQRGRVDEYVPNVEHRLQSQRVQLLARQESVEEGRVADRESASAVV